MNYKFLMKLSMILSIIFLSAGCQHLSECEKVNSAVLDNATEKECDSTSDIYSIYMNEDEENIEGPPSTEGIVSDESIPPEEIDFSKEVPHIWPIKDGSGYISSWFGASRSKGGGRSRVHKGIDIIVPKGTPVVATANGVVRLACSMNGYGLLIVIEHADGINSAYAHLSKVNVKEGYIVKEGDIIGLSGATGRVTTPHLHYEVRKEEIAINPVWFLPAEEE